ncbi:ABC transporter ATP-binding protein [Staphylococcus muscae]|uniref:ABC transporter ATP-binding protein n=1 Tax=Staphylococcus muscae TaxID=1294 RepID=A0A240C871_9STAP|nr:ABC transporter ATP-binding protein [Staphylococcus muscae]AVQ33445.1 ABC transporter ATP-binding protein [Staphylococcus muscae]PNZ04345.1 ABC transporter ATP-binding protein [Staphylococcus muscae]GGA90238.1 ABC transporter ATP-binding protein [Staphylococcus muscae]SNW03268.1 ABC transporter ATP-binding protein [Staphylococcus muscae]
MELKQISKQYNKHVVIDHIDFAFNDSRIVGLIGKNGVGKTTLMKIMNGNIVNYSGEVKVSNEDAIGYLIEHPKLYGNKTGLYNLKLFAQVLGKGYDKAYTDNIVRAFGMESYIHKKVKKYSMGMKQKLAIAVSLMNQPKFLILDEPTNGMDPDGSIDVLKTIEKLAKELDMKILISSHKLEDIELICDRAVFLRDGKFVQDMMLTGEQETGQTMIQVTHDDFEAACQYLAEHFNVIQVQKDEGVIIISQQQNYQWLLKGLSSQHIYPTYIQTRKATLRDTYFDINKRGDNA